MLVGPHCVADSVPALFLPGFDKGPLFAHSRLCPTDTIETHKNRVESVVSTLFFPGDISGRIGKLTESWMPESLVNRTDDPCPLEKVVAGPGRCVHRTRRVLVCFLVTRSPYFPPPRRQPVLHRAVPPFDFLDCTFQPDITFLPPQSPLLIKCVRLWRLLVFNTVFPGDPQLHLSPNKEYRESGTPAPPSRPCFPHCKVYQLYPRSGLDGVGVEHLVRAIPSRLCPLLFFRSFKPEATAFRSN